MKGNAMNRRKFMKVGGSSAAMVIAAPVVAVASVVTRNNEPLPPFEVGGLLTSASLNAMVARINELESRLG